MGRFMSRFPVICVLLVVLTHVTITEAQTDKKYFKLDSTFVLSPVSVSEQIYSVVWKYDKNLLGEWVKGLIPLTYYNKFRDRSELNTNTGVLVVRNVTTDDTGVYSVEINNRVQSRVYQIVVIKEVPQPTVELQPLACNKNNTNCTLVCHGETEKAEPVDYLWKKNDGKWDPSGTQSMLILNKDQTRRVKTFSCKIKNPVSEKESKPKDNPFYQENLEPESSGLGWIIPVVIVLIALLIAGAVFAYFKNTQFKNFVEGVTSTRSMNP